MAFDTLVALLQYVGMDVTGCIDVQLIQYNIYIKRYINKHLKIDGSINKRSEAKQGEMLNK